MSVTVIGAFSVPDVPPLYYTPARSRDVDAFRGFPNKLPAEFWSAKCLILRCELHRATRAVTCRRMHLTIRGQNSNWS